MKTMYQFMAVAVVAAVASLAWAQAAADKPTSLKGTVTKVEGANVTVKTDKTDVVVVVKTDEKTVVTVDGKKDKKVSDLAAGMTVKVTPAEGLATEIKAKTPKPPKAPKAAQPPAN